MADKEAFEVFLYTTAPEAYDYSTATTVETFECPVGAKSTWRKVRIACPHSSNERVLFLQRYQMGRYASGLNASRIDDPREGSPLPAKPFG